MPVINHLLSLSKPHAELIVLSSLHSFLWLHLYINNLRMNWFGNFIAALWSILQKLCANTSREKSVAKYLYHFYFKMVAYFKAFMNLVLQSFKIVYGDMEYNMEIFGVIVLKCYLNIWHSLFDLYDYFRFVWLFPSKLSNFLYFCRPYQTTRLSIFQKYLLVSMIFEKVPRWTDNFDNMINMLLAYFIIEFVTEHQR